MFLFIPVAKLATVLKFWWVIDLPVHGKEGCHHTHLQHSRPLSCAQQTASIVKKKMNGNK